MAKKKKKKNGKNKKKIVNKKIIYCEFCGAVNNINNKTCKKCHKSIDKNNGTVGYLIKNNIYNSKNIYRFVLNYIIYPLLVLVLIFLVISNIISVNNSNKSISNDYNISRLFSNVEIESNQDQVNNIFNNYLNEGNYDYDFLFDFKYLKINNLSNDKKISLGTSYNFYKTANFSSYDMDDKCSKFEGYSNGYKLCTKTLESISDDSPYGSYKSILIYDIDNEYIINNYYKYFNLENEKLENFEFKKDSGFCELNSDNNYLCYEFNKNVPYGIIKLIDSKNYSDHIELYINYNYCEYEGENSVCYADAKKEKIISRYTVINKYKSNVRYYSNARGYEYKLNFIKNSDGSYSWYDVVPVGDYYVMQ